MKKHQFCVGVFCFCISVKNWNYSFSKCGLFSHNICDGDRAPMVKRLPFTVNGRGEPIVMEENA